MKKILIVEDEKILAEMYRDKFILSNFEVISASSAEEAFEVLKKEKPDLILLDILLPGINGVDFLAKVKDFPQTFSIPIIAFSNYDDPETKRKAFDLGVKSYIIKTNYTPQEVVEKVKEYLK